jgi:hypothetical protein
VTVEKATKHIIVKSMNSTPHRGRFIVSSSAVRYLKKEEMFKIDSRKNNTNFDSVTFYDRTAVSAGGDVCSCEVVFALGGMIHQKGWVVREHLTDVSHLRSAALIRLVSV